MLQGRTEQKGYWEKGGGEDKGLYAGTQVPPGSYLLAAPSSLKMVLVGVWVTNLSELEIEGISLSFWYTHYGQQTF